MREYRCPSLNPYLPEDRCVLANEHEGDHEGRIRGRACLWDSSPVQISELSPDYYEPVEATDA